MEAIAERKAELPGSAYQMHSKKGIQVDERKKSKGEARAKKIEDVHARSLKNGQVCNPTFYCCYHCLIDSLAPQLACMLLP